MDSRLKTYPDKKAGFTLVELLIALALSALLLLGLVQIAAAASASTQLQRNQARIQEHARQAKNALSSAIHQAGFSPQPWNPSFPVLGLAETSVDDVSSVGDRLVLRSWTDLNCFDNRNPDLDGSGKPLFYIRESQFDMNTSKSLTHQCRYGPSLAQLTTQIRRQGFINEVESFQVMYGEDSDLNGSIEAWVVAGSWQDVTNVLGIRIGLLLSSQDAVANPASQNYQVLDSTIARQADGKLRRIVEFVAAIKGRTG